MKQLIEKALVTAITLSMPNIAQGQWSIGIECGPSMSRLTETRDDRKSAFVYEQDYAMPAGLFCTREVGHGFLAASGITYSPAGAIIADKHPLSGDFKAGALYTDCIAQLRLHYLSLPLAIQYHIAISKELSVFGAAGIRTQLLIVARWQEEGYGTLFGSDGMTELSTDYFDARRNVTADYRFWNADFETGIGLKWQVGDEHAVIKFCRNKGLRRIEKTTDIGGHTVDSYAFMFGYAIAIHPLKVRNCH